MESIATMPVTETGASEYLQAHPEHDGRGVVVAILDTGVDPRAPGLSTTSDGQTKVIDCYDCTGSGDVDTHTVVSAVPFSSNDAVYQITSPFTNRTFLVPTSWSSDQKYHIGVFHPRSFYPEVVRNRVKQERQKKFDVAQKTLLTSLRSQIAAAPQEGELKKELEAQLEIAQEMEGKEKDADHGSVADALVFLGSDGLWRAVLYLDEEGNEQGKEGEANKIVKVPIDLTKRTPLREYRVAHETDLFGEGSNLTYSVNIHADGALLEIVACAGSHGTHVAAIVAAYFGPGDSRNGVAPGAQIVSIKIGDSRLGTMETGTSFARALAQCIRSKVNVVNISYGELSASGDVGRIRDLLAEAQRNGITIVSSAGNEGPALGTVGAPGGVMSSCIGVGAILSSAMARDQHSLRPGVKMTPYSWSSRGPAVDGHLGVTICAPGAAITSIPRYSDSHSQLMNGTSMASPNAAGCVAILLSALRANKLPWSPAMVRRALEATAKRFPQGNSDAEEALSQGQGLVQVSAAVDNIIGLARAESHLVHYETSLSSGGRGIYLRDGAESETPVEEIITLRPVWDDRATSSYKSEFERHFKITTTQPTWVSVPDVLVLHNSDRGFRVLVDPTQLPRDAVHYAEVQGVDMAHPELGVAWRVPITVVRGVEMVKQGLTKYSAQGLTFFPGAVQRRFLKVPNVAGMWASITFKPHGIVPRRQFFVSTAQRVKEFGMKRTAIDEFIWLQDGDSTTIRVDLVPAATLEIAISQYTIQIGENGTVDVEVELHALQATTCSVPSLVSAPYAINAVTHTGVDVVPLQCVATLRDEKALPQGYYTTVIRRLNPTSTATSAFLHERDLQDPKWKTANFVETLNTYSLNISEKEATVLLRLAPLDSVLYESPFEAQMIHVFDENKERVHVGDYSATSFSLSKGKYTVRVYIRHPASESIQNAVKSLPLVLEKPLPKDKQVPASLYNSTHDAITGTSKLGTSGKPRVWRSQYGQTLVIGPPAESKLPKDTEAGDILLGYLLLRAPFEDESIPTSVPKKGLKPPIGSFPLTYVIPNKEKESTKEKEKASDRNARELLAAATTPEAAVAAFQRQSATELVAALNKNNRHADIEALLPQLLQQHAGHLPLLKVVVEWRLKLLTSPPQPLAPSSPEYIAKLRELVRATDALANEKDSDKKGEKLFATVTKIGALADFLIETHSDTAVGESDRTEFHKALNEALEILKGLNKSLDDIRALRGHIADDLVRGKIVSALRATRKALHSGNANNAQEKALRQLQVDLLRRLGESWAHWASLLDRRLLTQYPAVYPPL